MSTIRWMAAVTLLTGLSACGGDEPIRPTCDELQRYQTVVEGKRIVVPEGLDPLNEFAEMPIPKSQDAPSRPPGSPCIELPPRIETGR